jgi:hypothetical protein
MAHMTIEIVSDMIQNVSAGRPTTNRIKIVTKPELVKAIADIM